MKKTKVVCTIGPASENIETMTKLIEAGMNVMRMNFSHGDFIEQGNRIRTVRKLNAERGYNVGIMLDTKGPEIRTGFLKNDEPILINAGDVIRVTMDYSHIGTKEKIAISYPGLYDDIQVGGKILVEDGNLTLEVIEKDSSKTELVCRALNDRKLKNKRNCNVPGVILNMPYISKKDREDIEFACDNDVDYIAASFVRRASDIQDIRDILKSKGKETIKIISKIENQEGVDNMEEIIALSDGVMVARGDLGVDVQAWELPAIQKDMIYLAQSTGKIVITATQMLDSMQQNPRPTRAEVSDVFNSVLDGTGCTMLSGESAQGDYPHESVDFMSKIDEEAEYSIDNELMIQNVLAESNYEDARCNDMISLAVATIACYNDIRAVIATGSVEFAAKLSTYRPAVDIFFASTNQKDLTTLSIYYAINPVKGNQSDALEVADKLLKFERGDRILVINENSIKIEKL